MLSCVGSGAALAQEVPAAGPAASSAHELRPRLGRLLVLSGSLANDARNLHKEAAGSLRRVGDERAAPDAADKGQGKEAATSTAQAPAGDRPAQHQRAAPRPDAPAPAAAAQPEPAE